MRIFLSYPSEIKATAEPIAFSLRSRGHKVFLDIDDLPPGRSYDEKIQSAIEQTDVLIYLICPASVEKGRYTLTELEFARSAWSHPANRVLPVLIEPTEMSKVPTFLKGVTILEPRGNVTAEVAAAVERLRGSEALLKIAYKCALISSIVIAGTFFVGINNSGSLILNGLANGLPFMALAYFFRQKITWRMLLPLASVGLASMIASTVLGGQGMHTIDKFDVMDSSESVYKSDANKSDEELERNLKIEEQRERLIGLNYIVWKLNLAASYSVWGAIIALGALLGLAPASRSLGSPVRWMVVLVLASITAPLAWEILHRISDVLSSYTFGYAAGFGLFYAVLGGSMGYIHARGQTT